MRGLAPGAADSFSNDAIRRIAARRLSNHQPNTQSAPSNPVNQNAALQPHAAATGVMRSGVRMAPADPPLKVSAMPRDRLDAGNVWTTVRKPPGPAAPSPNPNKARAAAKLPKPAAKACDADASVHNETAAAMPFRNPMRSRILPHKGLPIVKRTEYAETTQPYAVTDRCVSLKIVGASSASVFRST